MARSAFDSASGRMRLQLVASSRAFLDAMVKLVTKAELVHDVVAAYRSELVEVLDVELVGRRAAGCSRSCKLSSMLRLRATATVETAPTTIRTAVSPARSRLTRTRRERPRRTGTGFLLVALARPGNASDLSCSGPAGPAFAPKGREERWLASSRATPRPSCRPGSTCRPGKRCAGLPGLRPVRRRHPDGVRRGAAQRPHRAGRRAAGRPGGPTRRPVRRPGRRVARPGAGRRGHRPGGCLRHQRGQALQVHPARAGQATHPRQAGRLGGGGVPTLADRRAGAASAPGHRRVGCHGSTNLAGQRFSGHQAAGSAVALAACDRTVRRRRGRHPCRRGRAPAFVLATLHPSAVLRADDREAAYDGLVADLTVAAKVLS